LAASRRIFTICSSVHFAFLIAAISIVVRRSSTLQPRLGPLFRQADHKRCGTRVCSGDAP
jgi:hypothetical protein